MTDCRYHLLKEHGGYRDGVPGRKPGGQERERVTLESIPQTCAIDVADEPSEITKERGHTLAEVAKYMGTSRERVRQIEETAMRKFRERYAAEFGAEVPPLETAKRR